MIEVPSYVRYHIDDLERALAKIREQCEELHALPATRETLDALERNEAIAASIERTLTAAKAEQGL